MARSAAETTTRLGEAQAAPSVPTTQDVIQGPVFGRRNYALMGASAAVIVVGFITLAAGSITLAPILLVLGYLVLVPLALLKR